MLISIACAGFAFLAGAVVFFRTNRIRNPLPAVLVIVMTACSFLYDNAAYLFDFLPHPDRYVLSETAMTKRGEHHAYNRARVSFEEEGEVKWTSVPIAFYEDVPKRIPVMKRNGNGREAPLTRTHGVITARTLVGMAFGFWVVLACMVKQANRSVAVTGRQSRSFEGF